MANFQIVETGGNLPYKPISVPGVITQTGQGAADEAMGQFAQTFTRGIRNIHIMQGQSEYSAAMADAKVIGNEAFLEMAKETDPNKYPVILDKHWKRIESRELNNGWAKKEYERGLPELRAGYQTALMKATWDRTVANHKIHLALAEADAIKTGSTAKYKQMLQTQVDAGEILAEERDVMLSRLKPKIEAKKHADEQQTMSAFAYANTDEVLGWKTAADMKKVFRDALNTDLTWIKGVARSAMSYRKGLEIEAIKEERSLAHKAASVGEISPAEFTEYVRKEMTHLSPEQQTQVVKTFNEATDVWGDTGKDHYKTRGSSEKYHELQRRVEKTVAGQDNITTDDLDYWTGRPDGINVVDYDKLAARLDGNDPGKSYFSESHIAKAFISAFNSSVLDTTTKVSKLHREEGLTRAQIWMQNHPDATDEEMRKQALRIYFDLEREAMEAETPLTLEGLTKIPKPRQWKAGQKITTGGEVVGTVDTDGKTLILNRNGLERLSRITRGNKDRAKEIVKERGWKADFNLWPSKRTPSTIPHMKIIEEADALKPGTKFYDPDGVLRIR